MKDRKVLDPNFLSNFNYVIKNLENDINLANNLEDQLYFEISKSDVINYLNYIYENIKSWKDMYNTKNYKKIIDKYKEIESIISELEFCLADYEKQFHMDGISYSIFQMGKNLVNITKENDKNGRK